MCFDPRSPEDFAVFYCPGIWKGVRFNFYAYIWSFVENRSPGHVCSFRGNVRNERNT